ncbi:helix-turn-helix domain-containing protein [Chryseobacterium wanjuense]
MSKNKKYSSMETKMIGNKIAAARKQKNISQAQLAQNVFVSPQAVGKWERGESLPDIITLNRLAEILSVDLNYFSESSELKETSITPSEFPEKPNIEVQTEEPKKKNKWDMSRGNWVNADFSGLKNLNEKFGFSNMKNCKFTGSDISGLALKSNHIDGCDFSNSDISKSHFQRSHLINNIFTECSLREAEISMSDVQSCDFSQTDFFGADFRSGTFRKNITTNAVWNQTAFNEMHLSDIIFNGEITDCSFENCSFTKVTFENAVLVNTFFKNKNLKNLRFINCTADRITYEFLKNGKADVAEINLLP